MTFEADGRALHRHRGFKQHLPGKFGKSRWLVVWNIVEGGRGETGRGDRFQNPLQGDDAIASAFSFQCQMRSTLYSVHFLVCPLPVILLVTVTTTALYGAYSVLG